MSEENNNINIPQDDADNTAEDITVSPEEGSESDAAIVSETIEAKHKKKKTIPLKTCLLSGVALLLVAVITTGMLTYSICAQIFRKEYADNIVKGDEVVENASASEIDLLNAYIDKYYYGDVDKDAMMDAALKAYVAATGDIYAAYYTLEELLANQESSAGRMSGIGVNIVNDEFEYEGKTLKCLHIYNVMDDSPAYKAGVKRDDRLVFVGTGENKQSVTELGYEKTLEQLLGEDGTAAEFTVYRPSGDGYDEIEFKNVIRGAVETTSVMATVLESDNSVGILTITGFDYTTPKQFERKVEELKNSGCNRFVIDLRYNPGGLLVSIRAVLSFFLDENDVFIQTKDSAGNVEKMTIAPIKYGSSDAAKCDIDAEDIGKYKDLDMVVLCNEGTASAAELFVANFKDYGIAKIVGANTFGKGKMQDTFMLNYGLSGAVKLTTHMYFSGGDTELVGYDGVGIVPDVTVKLNDEALNYFAYLVPQTVDNQLMTAVEQFN